MTMQLKPISGRLLLVAYVVLAVVSLRNFAYPKAAEPYIIIKQAGSSSELKNAEQSGSNTAPGVITDYGDVVLDDYDPEANELEPSYSISSLMQPFCPSGPSPLPSSLWFVKTYKTGGSTIAGVLRAICAHTGVVPLSQEDAAKAKSSHNNTYLATFLEQAYAASSNLGAAIVSHRRYTEKTADLFRKPLLMFTSVRHPSSRVHSHFIEIHCKSSLANDGGGCQYDTMDNRWEFIKSGYAQNNVFKYIKGRSTTPQEAADIYDFIFVNERMKESLVVFMLDYGLRFDDIAYLSAKNRTGMYKTSADMPQEMNEYVMDVNSLDAELWEIANNKLDERIAAAKNRCGVYTYDTAVATFDGILVAVADHCSDYIAWYSIHGFAEPYSYSGDNGMGPRCVQHVVKQFIATNGRMP